MGFNTVAVLYNDHSHSIEKQMPRLAWAMRSFGMGRDALAGHFGCGNIISQAHADTPQVTVIGMNSGEVIHHDNEVSDWAINAIVQVLEGRGYKVKAPKGD